ncbi:pitrilysin family protein [Spirulina sp. CS-785/01]|uniref:M16 family metallopeptidase n=1 Tax=Spirulina sp. CS-785/01 TaxID=3021716 RepID=UPI00232ABD26|nr:pitrilysin family protein [Spirulina sp. CS-785/01]MDB9313862.1 pitrilysin family protein [Spirulina sp. CS-785/01]
MSSAVQTPLVAVQTPTVERFANGLTIVAEQMPVEAVNFNLWLNLGSGVELDEINGMAHFLEHMIFKGTPQLKEGEFEQQIEQRGAVTNAATSQDYTHYYFTSAPRDLASLIPFQLDVVLNASIPDDAFERERLVVLEEIRRSQDNPSRRTYYQAMATCFEQLPYRRPVLGEEAAIAQFIPQQMRDFHQTWYTPDNITASVVGNLPVEELIQTVADAFHTTYTPKTKSSPQRLTLTPEPPFTEIVRREYSDPQLQRARLVMVWRVPGMEALEETYALDILARLLGRGRTSRLFRELREDRQLVSSIGATNMTHRTQGTFYISALLPPENLAEVEKTIVQHIRRFQEELVAERDLQRVRTLVANRFTFGNERPSDRANLYGYYQSQLGDLQAALSYPLQIQSIHAEDIQSAAQRYLNPDAYGVVIMKPVNN